MNYTCNYMYDAIKLGAIQVVTLGIIYLILYIINYYYLDLYFAILFMVWKILLKL